MNIAYALTAAVFAAIFLVAVMVFGGETARNIAILAAFLGCASQFTAQDERAYLVSIRLAYACFVAGLSSYIALLMGL